jgi:PAS domain S-box-containing protein
MWSPRGRTEPPGCPRCPQPFMPSFHPNAPRLSARTLRTALDQAVDAVVIADATGRIVYANAAIERHVGQPATDLIGRHFIVALAEGDDIAAYEPVSVALSEGRSWSGTRMLRTSLGLHIKVDIVASPVRDRSGVVTHILSIARSPREESLVAADDGQNGAPRAPRAAEPAPRVSEPVEPPITGSQTETQAEIELIISNGAFRPTFQPIVSIADRTVLGYEGLTRFDDRCLPEGRFAQATASGLGIELEQATLLAILDAARDLPAGGFLSVNVSPAFILDGSRLQEALADVPRSVVLEITERERVDDYAELRAAISRIGIPLRWAIDDAGAGFASLRHILELRPQFVKLDRGLIAGIALDPIRQALAAGLLHFSHALGTTLIAEGVETEAERLALRALGIPAAQGFLFGAPAPTRRSVKTASRG